MRDASPSVTRKDQGLESGTLWTLRRGDSSASCALVAFAGICELHVVLDGAPLLSQRCSGAEVFEVADQWRRRMLERGWRPDDVSPSPDLDSNDSRH